ncbi:metallophosphoesterase family protein [Bacillus sp. SD088]|uniref:metallophosphoesterase family protein n=1 Tax=Bacillus sp. SD088 TaxID=2782012 RepID=UPI001A977364|nr:metallophosphoesterase [Bacillus sp. SD088]MBO0992149.1 metallophosphoesterase [Bacillus sp. SD088]
MSSEIIYHPKERRRQTILRFLYLTDTHIGADPIGFHQQPAYPDKINQLISCLRKEIKKCHYDFIIHGGDLVQSCNEDTIRQAANLFRFSVPTYLCLGNHDLDHPDALKIWLNEAPNLFINQSPNFDIHADTCVVHVLPNHWECGREFYWGKIQEPYLSDEQLQLLETSINRNLDKIHVLVTHSPVFGMSTEQSGLKKVIHEPPATFQESILNMTQRYPQLKLVLSGHNHLNTLKSISNDVFITSSSFVETPFEFKIIELDQGYLRVKTCQIDLDAFNPEYAFEKAYVQGRKQDREVFVRFNKE